MLAGSPSSAQIPLTGHPEKAPPFRILRKSSPQKGFRASRRLRNFRCFLQSLASAGKRLQIDRGMLES